MQEGSGDTPASPPLRQHVTFLAAVTFLAPSSSATNGMESVTRPDSDGDSDATGPPEETPERETETGQGADATDWTLEENPEEPETPQRSALADDTATAAQYDDAFKPDDGCATPAHESVDSGDDGSSPHGEKQKPLPGASGKRPDVAAAAKSRLLAFRSLSWDKKGRKSGDEGPPDGHGRVPADGKAWEEAGAEAEHKDKGKARWKKLWK